MDHPDTDHYLSVDLQQNMLLEMMKQHISNGLPIQYTTNYSDQNIPQQSDEDTSSHVEQDQDEPMPIVYKKRARVKFTQEQINVLETTFQQHRYPTIDMIDDLVEQLHLPTQKITVWFQNRRARLKKSQQKLENHQSFERDNQEQYDSGIHLDDDVSRASSTSPPVNLFPQPSPINYLPPPPPSYYLPNPSQTFYNPMWPNFRYPLQPSYDSVNYNSPFVFHDISNYSHSTGFHGEF